MEDFAVRERVVEVGFYSHKFVDETFQKGSKSGFERFNVKLMAASVALENKEFENLTGKSIV